MITQDDRDAAKPIAIRAMIGELSHEHLHEAFAAHRIAAEQAVLDRLRDLPDDVALKVYHAAGNIGVDLAPSMARLIITAAVDALEADALEQQP